jgi:peptidoglycan lytic transglycosylase
LITHRIRYLVTFLFCFLMCVSQVFAAKDPVSRLQDSFTADQAERKKIYSEVVSLADNLSAGTTPDDRKALLAGAVALKQMAMDAEDEFFKKMISSAPDFRKLSGQSQDFLRQHRRAAQRFEKLSAKYPFIRSYGASSSLIVRHWQDGSALLHAAISYKEEFPASRFWRRLALLAGCSLILENKYQDALDVFRWLWNESPSNTQAVTAYRLVDALEQSVNHSGFGLNVAQRLAWGKALGFSGNSVLEKMIKLFPATKEAEEAYYQIFRNIRNGFAMRPLSSNYKQAKRFDRLFKSFNEKYSRSEYFEKSIVLLADFHYSCGKKSQAIARKNEYRWRKSGKSSSRKVSLRYSGYADRHFDRVAALDLMVAESLPDSSYLFRVGLLNALTMFERDRFDLAADRLETLLDRGPDSLALNQILWYRGLIHYMKGEFQAAMNLLGRFEKSAHKDPGFWSRGMLFLGKAYLAAGDSVSATRAFSALSRAYPYTYHGIRARSLKRGFSQGNGLQGWLDFPLDNLTRFPDKYTPEGEQYQREAADWQSLGFFAEASYIYSSGLSEAPEDLLLRYRHHENYLRAGWFHRVLRSFRGEFREFLYRGGYGLPDNFWQLAYLNPEPYRDIIARESVKFKIPGSLIAAMMRQESNFNAGARSHAGARGLMQLLPSLARRLSKGMGLGRITNRRLYDPKVNLPLGVKFLAGNLKKYNGNIALAISCYNADPRNLPVWLERMNAIRHSAQFDLDLFIELIPLEETHDYNIQVLTNFWRYQEVYGETGNLFCWELESF